MIDVLVDPNILPEYFFKGETSHRALYRSEQNVDLWLSLSASSKYPGAEKVRDPVLEMYRQTIKDICKPELDQTTFLSFGCGDGRIDYELIELLYRNGMIVKYVPIDISRRLLELSINKLSKIVNIPFGIETDFESGLDYLFKQIEPYRNNPIILGMLGNTLCSLDKGMEPFLSNLRNKFLANDMFFISVAEGPINIERGRFTVEKLKKLCAEIFSVEMRCECTSEDISASFSEDNNSPEKYCVSYCEKISNAELLKINGIDSDFPRHIEDVLNMKLYGENHLKDAEGMIFGVGCYVFKKL